MGLLCAAQNVGYLNKKHQKNTNAFRRSGTLVRRTRRRISQKLNFHEFWDSCAQNKASEISKNGLSGIRGLLCAEQNVGNIKKMTFRNYGSPVRRTRRRTCQILYCQNLWDFCAQNMTSDISESAPSGIRGFLCAEQNVGNIKKCTFRRSWTLVRRTQRRTSQRMHFHN